MNYRNILYMISMLLLAISFGMFLSVGVGHYYGDTRQQFMPMVHCASIVLVCSMIGIAFSWHRNTITNQKKFFREGFLSVALAWAAAIFFGAMPFVTGARFCWADAIFETASGFSTTGATVIGTNPPLRLNDGTLLTGSLESLSKCLLFWRCFLNWMGGIGFVILAMLLLPVLGGAKQLYNAEVPGLKNTGEQFTARIATTARLLLGCYVVWTLIVTTGFRLLGMETWFDAACHAFATVATGGFSNHSESFGYFKQPALQMFCAVAMVISALDLMLLLKFFFFGKFEFHKDEQTFWFLMIILAATMLIRMQMKTSSSITFTDGSKAPLTIETAVRTAFFQVASIITTTGFATSDYETWNLPGLPAVMLLIMIFGGCGGSTAGGFKIMRLIIVCKQAILDIKQKIFPHLVPNVHLGEDNVPQTVVNSTLAFFFLYITTITICTLLLPYLSPMDYITAFSSAVTSVSNVGPGLGKVSPSWTFAWMAPSAKLLLAFAMIAGRLELYTILIIFLPSFWHTKKKYLSNK